MNASSDFVIGIDGGASKTAALIASADGSTVVRCRGPGSAIIGRPHLGAVSVLATILRELIEGAGISVSDVGRIVLGLSGIDYADEQPTQARDLAEGLGLSQDRLVVVNDSVIALAGATSAARSTIVQHGTEVTLAFRSAPGQEQVFDSLGVADCFDIRHKAVPLVARMIDGRAERTPLCEAVLNHCGVAADRFARWVLCDRNAQRGILTLAPVVFGRWQEGDPAAATLVQNAIADYVTATIAMARRMDAPGAFAACFGGGTLAVGGRALTDAIAARLAEVCPEAKLVTPAYSPETGAVLLALQRLDLPQAPFLRRLEAGVPDH